ncbi:MAG: AAA family ATPase [Fimbriimonadales bacterium]
MKGHRTITRLKLQSFLSFDDEGIDLELQPLNVLIGPNGSGKSNFLEAIRLLHCLPNGTATFITRGQAPADYVWKGDANNTYFNLQAWLTIDDWLIDEPTEYHHVLALHPFLDRLRVLTEHIGVDANDIGTLWERSGPRVRVLRAVEVEDSDGQRRVENRLEKVEDGEENTDSGTAYGYASVPHLHVLANAYRGFRTYGTQSFGINAESRKPQKTDLDQASLFEDGSNLPNVIESLQHLTPVMNRINGYLQEFYPNAIRLTPGLRGGQTQLFLEERYLKQTLPATRLSDGTIRFLCMLALFLHPDPPKVITLEEPELGLHPDVIRLVAKLLVEASEKSQIFVTTHSEILVSALSDQPEAILICEKEEKGTQARRLNAEELTPWLKKYTLGELWMSGEIGGVRG